MKSRLKRDLLAFVNSVLVETLVAGLFVVLASKNETSSIDIIKPLSTFL